MPLSEVAPSRGMSEIHFRKNGNELHLRWDDETDPLPEAQRLYDNNDPQVNEGDQEFPMGSYELAVVRQIARHPEESFQFPTPNEYWSVEVRLSPYRSVQSIICKRLHECVQNGLTA